MNSIILSTNQIKQIEKGYSSFSLRLVRVPTEWEFVNFEKNPFAKTFDENGNSHQDKLKGFWAIFSKEAKKHTMKQMLRKIGDILYVKEKWYSGCKYCESNQDDWLDVVCAMPCDFGILYKAKKDDKRYFYEVINQKWFSAKKMPRHLSRLRVEVTDVRIQRLQTITEAERINVCKANIQTANEGNELMPKTFLNGFADMWNNNYINGEYKYSWDNNPWVCISSIKKYDAL